MIFGSTFRHGAVPANQSLRSSAFAFLWNGLVFAFGLVSEQRIPDAHYASRATALGRILFTRDDDLLREGALRQKRGESFAGIIYAHQLDVSIGQCVIDLELVAKGRIPTNGLVVSSTCR